MKTAVIIIICVLALLIVFAMLKRKAKATMTNQPLYAISKDGFLGFVIGDTFKFVWSRINHLGLMNQKEMDDFKSNMEVMQMIGFGSNTIRMAKNKFEGIDYISMSFDERNCLNSIMVYVNNKPNTTAKAYMKELRDKYVNLLGEPKVDSDIVYQWAFKNVLIVLCYTDNQILLHIHDKNYLS